MGGAIERSRFWRLVREVQDVAVGETSDLLEDPAEDRADGLAGAAHQGLAEADQCELCGAALWVEHRHLHEEARDRILCICRACTLLFAREGAGGGSYRLVPERVIELPALDLDETLWSRFEIPVGLAFFRRLGERVVVEYPGAMGTVGATVEEGPWNDLVDRNPILLEMEPGVEALLVDRTAGRGVCWIAPIDRCYQLAGIIRRHWRGVGGGEAVWSEVRRFREGLRNSGRGQEMGNRK